MMFKINLNCAIKMWLYHALLNSKYDLKTSKIVLELIPFLKTKDNFLNNPELFYIEAVKPLDIEFSINEEQKQFLKDFVNLLLTLEDKFPAVVWLILEKISSQLT